MRTFDLRVVAIALSAVVVSGLLGVPWAHAAIAGASIVGFRVGIGALPVLRPLALPQPPAPSTDGRQIVRGPGGALSRREQEVALLVAEGLTNKAIGQRLFIAESTVDTHVLNAMGKLNVHHRAEIVTKLAEHGLIPQRRRQP